MIWGSLMLSSLSQDTSSFEYVCTTRILLAMCLHSAHTIYLFLHISSSDSHGSGKKRPPVVLKPKGHSCWRQDWMEWVCEECSRQPDAGSQQQVCNRPRAQSTDGTFGWKHLVAGNRQKPKHSSGQRRVGLLGGGVVPFPEKEGFWEGKHNTDTGWGRENRKPVISRSLMGKIRQEPRCWKFFMRPEYRSGKVDSAPRKSPLWSSWPGRRLVSESSLGWGGWIPNQAYGVEL